MKSIQKTLFLMGTCKIHPVFNQQQEITLP